ncbi:MAG: metallophosphoesterase, partial [Blastocatellia bacterium]
MITRRQAIASLATLTAGTLIKPTSILGFESDDSKTRFAVIGDFGTGGSDECGVASEMLETHKQAALDFVLTVGDNIYPNGSGRLFAKNFEEPFAGLLKEKVKFYAALGNHDVEDGRSDQCNYPLFNMGGSCYYSIKRGNGLIEFFVLDSTNFDNGQL